MWFYFLFYLCISLLKDRMSFPHGWLIYIQINIEYMDMINRVIQLLLSLLEQIFWIYCSCVTFFYFFMYNKMLRFDKAIYLFFLLKSVRLSNSLSGSDVLLFLGFINIVFILVLYLYWIHYFVIYFFSNFFCSMQRVYDLSHISCLLINCSDLFQLFV